MNERELETLQHAYICIEKLINRLSYKGEVDGLDKEYAEKVLGRIYSLLPKEKSIGDMIEEKRQKLGWLKEAVAKFIGINYGNYYNIVNNFQHPSISTKEKIRDFLNLPENNTFMDKIDRKK